MMGCDDQARQAGVFFPPVDAQAAARHDRGMSMPSTPLSPEFQRGWDAALAAVRLWHEAQAKKSMILAQRSRFPKNLEREAEVHRHAADQIGALRSDDV
jgi:hypothetical protein